VFLAPKGGRSSPLSPLSPAVGASILNPFRFSKQFQKGYSAKFV
jgi:ribosomal protein L11